MTEFPVRSNGNTSGQSGAKPGARLIFLDNLRIYLTILVIVHHAALAYGGAGSWSIRDPAVDDISPIFLTLFNALNQSYFMTAFFLLAGYFTPRSLETKGPKSFLIDRLIRLGVPLLVYTTLIININGYIIDVFGLGVPYQMRIEYDAGHLWFLQALLIFAVIYVIFRAVTDRGATNSQGGDTPQPIRFYPDTFPPDGVLFLSVAMLSMLTFLVRLVFPVGVWFLKVQPGHFVHYTFAFYVGILAYRGDWFRRLSKGQARRWGIMSLGVFLLIFVMMVLGGALESEENAAKFMGGAYWQAFVYAVWETFLMIGIIVFLLYFFRERLNQAGPNARSMAASVFTVYIIHQTILFALHALFLSIDIPTIVKFFVVSLIAVPVCFLLSIPIRRIPYARRVLG
jgi:surface polysaccharide O-acyltransferase-like enzyme